VRRVFSDGSIHLRNDRLFISEALAGCEIGLEAVDAMRVRAWFRDINLGVLETLPDVDVSCFEERERRTKPSRARQRGSHAPLPVDTGDASAAQG
jgi:hypothetical protein